MKTRSHNKECEYCHKSITYKNYARHKKQCKDKPEEEKSSEVEKEKQKEKQNLPDKKEIEREHRQRERHKEKHKYLECRECGIKLNTENIYQQKKIQDICKNCFKEQQEGEGFHINHLSDLQDQRGKGIFGDIASTVGKSAYYVASKIIDPMNDLKYGEIHQPKLGKSILRPIEFSQTSGPGSDIVNRVKQGRIGNINKGDAVELSSQRHDIEYTLNGQQGQHQADEKMLDTLKNKTNWWNPVDAINSGISYAGIWAKKNIDDKFGNTYTPSDKISDQDKQVLQKRLDQLKNAGYGENRHGERRKKKRILTDKQRVALKKGREALQKWKQEHK